MPITIMSGSMKYRDENGNYQNLDCIKGDKGDPGDPTELIDDTAGTGDTNKVWSADKSASEKSSTMSAINAKYTKPVDGIPASDLASGVIPSVPVQDVQLGGTSILNNGIANIPPATTGVNGYARIDATYGVNSNQWGRLYVQKGNADEVKAGTGLYRPIVPYHQHESVYYALAKLAGADMASVTGETVGVYPEAQKVAIQKMLGIYEAPWELIREDEVTNATEADINITVDGNGNPFELTDVRIEFYSPIQQTNFSKGDYGRIEIFYGSSSSAADRTFIGAYTQNANASARYSYVIIEQNGGMITKTYMTNTGSGDNGQLRAYAQPTGMFYIASKVYSKIVITKVTGTAHYKLYGKRKWN